jgi:hypothetical protein
VVCLSFGFERMTARLLPFRVDVDMVLSCVPMEGRPANEAADGPSMAYDAEQMRETSGAAGCQSDAV